MREAGRIRHAVVIVMDRVDAGAVHVPCFDQTVEGPKVVLAYRETRRPVALDAHAARILEQLLGSRDIGQESRRRQVARPLVPMPMAGQFVTGIDDAPDQRRVSLGNPSQREEGGRRTAVCEQAENSIDVALDPALTAIPLIARDIGRKRRDLEVVFDVDRQRIGDLGCEHECGATSAPPSATAEAGYFLDFSRSTDACVAAGFSVFSDFSGRASAAGSPATAGGCLTAATKR